MNFFGHGGDCGGETWGRGGCGCDCCSIILLLLLSNCGMKCDPCQIIWLLLIQNCLCGGKNEPCGNC